MIAQQPYQVILPLHFWARAIFQATRGYPSSQKTFGSLIVVFPTPHEGGTLITRHRGQEWVFDSAAALRLSTTPPSSICYVAFFSDVKHNTTPVVSSLRVTLTYNLYFDDDDGRGPTPAGGLTSELASRVVANEQGFCGAFHGFLELLPDGGMLGFGLRHVYQVEAVDGSSMSTVCSSGATQLCIEPSARLGSSPCTRITSHSGWTASLSKLGSLIG